MDYPDRPTRKQKLEKLTKEKRTRKTVFPKPRQAGGEQCQQARWRRKASGDSQKIIYGPAKRAGEPCTEAESERPLSKSHASPFTHRLAEAIFRNINSALRTPFARRCLLRGASHRRLNNQRCGGAFLFPFFSHYKFSAPDSNRPVRPLRPFVSPSPPPSMPNNSRETRFHAYVQSPNINDGVAPVWCW